MDNVEEEFEDTAFIDESFFTGESPAEEKKEDSLNNMLQSQYSPKQLGSIAKFIEPINGNSPLETATKFFEESPDVRVLPVEAYDRVVGFIDRKTLEVSTNTFLKRLTSSNIIDYTQKTEAIFYASDYIENILKKISDINRATGIVYFCVFDSRSFYGMVSLDDVLDRISEIREQDLEKASFIQQTFFPHEDSLQDLPYRIFTWNKMANALGGDMIQLYKLSDKKSIVGCFDVSGKNVAASLLTITIGTFFTSLSLMNYAEKNPVKIIAMLDSYLHKIVPPGNFITAVICYVDFESRKICLFNCGHTTTYMLFKDSPEDERGKIASVNPKLPPLGMGVVKAELEKANAGKRPYIAYDIRFGLHIDMYSDGLTDMKNVDDIRFEDERTKKFFASLYDVKDQNVVETIQKQVDDWTGTTMLPDDITVIDIRF